MKLFNFFGLQILLHFPLFILSIIDANAAPRPKFKYGNVSPKDFATTKYEVDTSASAVFLFDNGKAHFEGNNAGYLSVIYTKHARIHILNKNGFDAATVEFPIYNYSDNTYDKIKKFEAVVYNLENGKIVETKVEKESIFKDKVVKGLTVHKFTFPNVKEGSILEYRYTLEVPNPGGLRTWRFQEDHPRLWSELDLSLPDIYRYTPLTYGLQKFDYDTVFFKTGSFSIVDRSDSYSRSNLFTVNCGVTQRIWGMQNVPALKAEPFVISPKNHQARLEFMYTAFAPDNGNPQPVMQNWFQIAETLLKDSDFGADLDAPNNFLDAEVERLKGKDTNQLALAKRVYYFVRDNFSCPDHNAIFLSQPIKKTYQERKGNVADLNLLLVALYRKLGFAANPVMLSTRSNGLPPENYPLLRNFNYILCHLNVSDKLYVLDASISSLGFNKLDRECYNDNGRMIAATPYIVILRSDSLLDTKTTSVFIGKDEKGIMGGAFSSTLTYEESREIRKKLKTQKLEEVIAEMQKKYSAETEIVKPKIDSLYNLEEPLKIRYELLFPWEEDIIYFNPTLAEGYKENPFKATVREHPIQLGASFDEIFTMNIQVPDDYVVDEMPKSAKLYYDGNKGQFEYILSKSGSTVYFKMRLKFTAANFDAEEYDELRDYFSQIVKKQSEQIVFKKKK
jgi:hypothetical protein